MARTTSNIIDGCLLLIIAMGIALFLIAVMQSSRPVPVEPPAAYCIPGGTVPAQLCSTLKHKENV